MTMDDGRWTMDDGRWTMDDGDEQKSRPRGLGPTSSVSGASLAVDDADLRKACYNRLLSDEPTTPTNLLRAPPQL